MKRYIAARLVIVIPTLIGVLLSVFLILRLVPGDPAAIMLGKNATDEQIRLFREQNGLDKNIGVQMVIVLKKFAKGDLGNSIASGRPVLDMILERFPRTAELAICGVLLGAAIGILQGIIAAVYRGRWPDLTITTLSTIGMSVPSFYIAMLVLLVFAVKLKWIPVIATEGPGVSHFKAMIAPVLTMVLGGSALTVRTTRSAMLEILNEDFILTARAKGVRERGVLLNHALRNAAIPIITVVGDNLASSFGGAIVIETVFVRPGIGKLLVDAINARDYPVVQGTSVFIAFLLIFVILLTDIVYSLADPRVRLQKSE
ncbi:ABC transporter permease [Tepidanaerobacter syntrophicus]|uniref:ABC transporter permease n=1 Tax=Tepidanaerobacter syntrophicus TaxID=224999 RepID=UPI001BD4E232|nr:ABC transporter permease [Tepidanaerobacter syntrophicus]